MPLFAYKASHYENPVCPYYADNHNRADDFSLQIGIKNEKKHTGQTTSPIFYHFSPLTKCIKKDALKKY
jgi:hypothetical protein